MSAKPPALRLVAAGAVTSVGNDLPSTCAALDAVLDRFGETAFIDQSGQPLIGAAFDFGDAGNDARGPIGGAEKLSLALSWAIEECLRRAAVALPLPAGVPLLFLGDDTRSTALVETAQLCHAACSPFFPPNGQLHRQAFTAGEAACVHALQAADAFLAEGAPYVLLVAVDSWLSVPDIQHGLAHGRLLTASNAAGFVPGEAAAALLLARPGAAPARAHVDVRGLGLAQESAPLLSGEPCYGQGAAAALRQALAQAGWGAHEIDLRLSDNAGEIYFAEELAYAWARVLRAAQPPEHDYLQIASRLGHVGTAFGPLLLAYLWELARLGQLPRGRALLQLSSTQAERGAIAVQIPGR